MKTDHIIIPTILLF